MPYIDQNGRVVEKQPWSIQRVKGMFWGIVMFFWVFINTLLGKNVNRQGSNFEREYRGGGGPPKPPSNKRIGGLSSPKDAPGGGCASCAK